MGTSGGQANDNGDAVRPANDDGPADRPLVAVRREGAILRLTLDAPPANALSRAMMAELQAAVDLAGSSREVRVVAIDAPGKLFSAGHDLKELTAHRADADGGAAFYRETFEACAALMTSIVRCPKPVVAIVEGLATAAGCQLVASCDLAIASDKATFCTPGVHIGLFCSTPMVALSRAVHRKHAMEMLLTGEAIDASTAREMGLVNRVVPESYLRQVTDQYARNIAAKSARTLRVGKEAFQEQAEMGLAEAYEYTISVMSENMMDAAAKEGIGAFLEHREPNWRDA